VVNVAAVAARIDVVVRVDALAEDDWGRIDTIERASFDRPWSRSSFAREAELGFSRLLVARDPQDERIIGYLCRWQIEDELQILNVAVAPEVRRRGIARQLLAEVLAEARTSKYRVVLEVEASNAAALALYRAHGFEPSGRRKNFYGSGRDGLTMVLAAADSKA